MTNEEAKQQAIINAYGEYWGKVKDFVTEDGWFYNRDTDFRLDNTGIPQNYDAVNLKSRPKSLQGIENNNGWINTNDKLPTEFGFYHVEIENNKQDLLAYFNLELKTWTVGDFEFNVKKWQPINYPKKSIY